MPYVAETEFVIEDDHLHLPSPRTYQVSGDVTPGDPGCHTMRNGDPGWPPSGPEAEVTEIHYQGAKLADDDWKNHRIGEKQVEEMVDALFEQANDNARAAEDDDHDRAYDDWKDQQDD